MNPNSTQEDQHPQHQRPQHQRPLAQDIPEHFYDSDMASVNEKDFLSDSQPPKDEISERKLLFKSGSMHVYKTMVRIGGSLAKPARYDRVHIKCKVVPAADVVPRPNKKAEPLPKDYKFPDYFSSEYLLDVEEECYNLGKENMHIEKFVVSMKRGEMAVFEQENLQVSAKSNIKLRKSVDVYVIAVNDWQTVIDLDCDGKFMKDVIQSGQGSYRVCLYDQVSFQFEINRNGAVQLKGSYLQPAKMETQFINSLPNFLWHILSSCKAKQQLKMTVSDQVIRDYQKEKYARISPEDSVAPWNIWMKVHSLVSIDDVHLNGSVLKKCVLKGVSSAKPDSSSLVYYALKFLDCNKNVIKTDECFSSDWWEDFGKLDELGCRKNYLDDFQVSNMLKSALKRMKPGQIAEIECRRPELFQYGCDYQQLKALLQFQQAPSKVHLLVRVYNFTEGKNCFNMNIEEKIQESKRKKQVAVLLLSKGKIQQALKRFQSIVAYYGSGDINQEAYHEKISALMNSVLCLMKQEKYSELLPLCEEVLQTPKHGYDIQKVTIKGPNDSKSEGNSSSDANQAQDPRQQAHLLQNQAILDKCLYRKAFALLQLGESQKALKSLDLIVTLSEETTQLRGKAEKMLKKYEDKSIKIFKSMFG